MNLLFLRSAGRPCVIGGVNEGDWRWLVVVAAASSSSSNIRTTHIITWNLSTHHIMTAFIFRFVTVMLQRPCFFAHGFIFFLQQYFRATLFIIQYSFIRYLCSPPTFWLRTHSLHLWGCRLSGSSMPVFVRWNPVGRYRIHLDHVHFGFWACWLCCHVPLEDSGPRKGRE